MRKSLRLSAALLIIGFALTALTGCNEEPIDTVWDGNYIYSSIYKCKTHGEDQEVLVDEVVADGKTYKYDHVSDYIYIGKTLFLDATFIGDEERRQVFFIKYSIEDNTHEVLCYDTEF